MDTEKIAWATILQKMDQVPEGQRKLAQSYAWSTALECGCIWGTLAVSPRFRDREINLDFRRVRDAYGSWGAYDWFKENQIPRAAIVDLQVINDSVLNVDNQGSTNSQLSLTNRWGVVYDYVLMRVEGMSDMQARFQLGVRLYNGLDHA